jgi:hypothetical protein
VEVVPIADEAEWVGMMAEEIDLFLEMVRGCMEDEEGDSSLGFDVELRGTSGGNLNLERGFIRCGGAYSCEVEWGTIGEERRRDTDEDEPVCLGPVVCRKGGPGT